MSVDVAAGEVPQWTMGDRLRKARQKIGLEQADFAEEIGIGRTTLINYENDKRAPKSIVLKAVALRTGVPLWWLEGRESPRPVGPGGGQGLPRQDLNLRPSD